MNRGREKGPPSFQFYPRDFLSSTAVSLMSPEARGGYITLLCHAWLADEPGVLPDDDAILASLSGLADRWPACSVAIRRAFRATSREGRLVLMQRRMLDERSEQAIRHAGASLGGHRSASLLTPEQRKNKAVSAARARWMLTECSPNAHRMPTPASASASAVEPTRSTVPDAVSQELDRGKDRTVHATKKSRAPFRVPTREEVATYCRQRQAEGKPPVDPDRWYDHYTANGWRVGRNPMRNWQAAVRQWERAEYAGNGTPRPGYTARGGLTAEAVQAFAARLREEQAHEQS